MIEIEKASLSAQERILLGTFVERLSSQFAGELHDVWLFGSRARGEPPSPDSDIDLLIFLEDAAWASKMRVHDVLRQSAREVGLEPLTWSFSLHIHTVEWLAERRRIESFFIAEVDRDKVHVHVRGVG